jgi:hypothetical protein
MGERRGNARPLLESAPSHSTDVPLSASPTVDGRGSHGGWQWEQRRYIALGGCPRGGVLSTHRRWGYPRGGLLHVREQGRRAQVHLVEIAIGILRAAPTEDVTPARGWALDVIEKNSGVPFTKEDREALLHKPLPDWNWKLVWPDNGGAPRLMGPFEQMQRYFDTHPNSYGTPAEQPPQTPPKGK